MYKGLDAKLRLEVPSNGINLASPLQNSPSSAFMRFNLCGVRGHDNTPTHSNYCFQGLLFDPDLVRVWFDATLDSNIKLPHMSDDGYEATMSRICNEVACIFGAGSHVHCYGIWCDDEHLIIITAWAANGTLESLYHHVIVLFLMAIIHNHHHPNNEMDWAD